jgi:hypothetical protein
MKGYKYTAMAEDNYNLPCDDNMDLYIHSPIRLNDVVLNYLCIGTTFTCDHNAIFCSWYQASIIWSLEMLRENFHANTILKDYLIARV